MPLLLIMAVWGCAREDTLFRELSPAQSGISFSNDLSPDEQFNIIEYLYFYNGGGVAVGDVNNDGLPDLYFTANQKPNALYLNRGGLRFDDVSETAGVQGMDGWSTGVTMADVNADGWLDIYVCHLGDYKGISGHNELFINQQDGTFREAAAEFGLDFKGFATQAAFFDYDQDGDLDCYLLNHSVHSTENYGSSELRRQRNALAGDRLMRNEGAGRGFVDVSEEAGIFGSRIGYGLGIATGDLNDDGCPDLYIANDFHENDYLYYNNCDGTFREALTASMGYTSTFSMGNDIADFDNDGRLDLISLDMKPFDEEVRKRSVGADPYNIYQFKLSFGYHYQFPRNMLQWNRGNLLDGNASFSEIGQMVGVDATDWSWSPLFADLDNDGLKDLFVSNGIWQRPNDLDYLKYSSNQQMQANATDAELAAIMPPGRVSNLAFRNRGDLRFENISRAWGLDLKGSTTGAVQADLDRDGDLDIVLNNLNDNASILENHLQGGHHFLRVRLKGNASNPFALGARVTLRTDAGQQVQELYTTRGFLSAGEPVLHFGLGTSAQVEEMWVRWPGGGVSHLVSLPVDQEFTVDQEGMVREVAQAETDAPEALFKRLEAPDIPVFRHKEDAYVDFDNALLMPHMISKKGPRMAAGDVNGDGREDLYICGARGQSGALFVQEAQGSFHRMDLRTDERREEVDAVFLDADGDDDLDLYLVCGGGEAFMLPDLRRDQLWLNDGKGNFEDASFRLPGELNADGACAVPFDADADGDLDLFVGVRSIPGFYGVVPDSYLLRNDGNGQFEDATGALAPGLRGLGLVTDACLIEMKGNPQLVVVGEWMPVTLFRRQGESWHAETIENSEGWWNAVHPADLDGDGDTDLLLGNLGLNADLKASTEEPVEMFVKDFDQNRQVDPIITYYRDGERHTYASFHDLSMQLVDLRKEFGSYEEFASRDVEEVFPSGRLSGAVHHIVRNFASGIMLQENGSFRFRPFPREAQISPLFAFGTGDLDGDGRVDILAAGNFYESIPALGRYDASFGHVFLAEGSGAFKPLEPSASGFVLPGQSRDMALMTVNGKVRVLVARNDAEPLGFELLSYFTRKNDGPQPRTTATQ